MVKFIAALLIFIPTFLHAGSFTATVDDSTVGLGETIELILSLKDASAKGQPDHHPLLEKFKIAGQSQASNIQFINGTQSMTTSWTYILLPKGDGDISIPSISMETSEGTLTTQPFKVSVSKTNAPEKGKEGVSLTVEAQVSEKEPYINQAIVYTVSIVHGPNVVNLQLDPPSVTDAIIEQLGKPQSNREMIDGETQTVVKVQYLVTPLKAGNFTIFPITLQGQVVSKEKGKKRRRSPFDDFPGFDIFAGLDPFSSRNYKPFVKQSNEVVVKVRPAATNMDPWLPLTSLELSDMLSDEKKAKVGEPITRTITILAKGIGGSQLPDLKSQLETPDFKVYEDRPVTGQEVKEGSIHGWKTATYTLIPRKDGELTLPEIKVPWWDIQNNRLAEAILPAKTISIAPGEAGSIERPEPEQKAQEPEQLVEETITETETSREPASAVKAEPETQSILHIVILLLLLGLIGVFTWGVRMYRQNNRASQIRPHPMKRRETKSPKKMAKLPIAKINSIQDLIELQEFLKAYSRDHWGTSTNASLREISDVLLAQEPDLDKDFVLLLFKKLDEALYANKKVDIVAWKVDFQKVIKQTASKQSGAKNKSSEGLPDLNPR